MSRWIWLLVSVPHVAAVILSDSRGAFLALVAVIPPMVFVPVWRMEAGRKWIWRLTTAMLYAGAAAVTLFLLRRLAVQVSGGVQSLYRRLYGWAEKKIVERREGKKAKAGA